jgi:hypothetical protein
MFRPWEFVGFVSKTTIVGLILFAAQRLRNPSGKRIVFDISWMMLAWLICYFAAGREINNTIYALRNYHNPIKILAVFVPFFSLMMGAVLHEFSISPLTRKIPNVLKTILFFSGCMLLLVEFNVYTNFFVENKLGIRSTYYKSIYETLKSNGGIEKVKYVNDIKGTDIYGLIYGETSIKCYEPVFGYYLERLDTEAKPGRVDRISDGEFNLNHPGCLVYPDYFNCRAWDRIDAGDKENFELFIEGKTPKWKSPPWQQAMIYFNLLVVLLVAILASSDPVKGIYQLTRYRIHEKAQM